MQEIMFSALLMGLLGSGHCIAMCGGIASALGLNTQDKLGGAVIYQVGRVSSYILAGLLVGLSGFFIPSSFLPALRIFAALLIIALAFSYLGVASPVRWIERAGLPIWNKLKPLTKSIGRPSSTYQYFLTGMIWGWLPCGLVYSALALSISQSDAYKSAITMALFGLGTMPSMLSITVAGSGLKAWFAKPLVRKGSGIIMLLMAANMLTSIYIHSQHVMPVEPEQSIVPGMHRSPDHQDN